MKHTLIMTFYRHMEHCTPWNPLQYSNCIHNIILFTLHISSNHYEQKETITFIVPFRHCLFHFTPLSTSLLCLLFIGEHFDLKWDISLLPLACWTIQSPVFKTSATIDWYTDNHFRYVFFTLWTFEMSCLNPMLSKQSTFVTLPD